MPFRKIKDEDDDTWNKYNACRHPEHEPPGMIVLDPGRYEYTCPGCGRAITINVPDIMHMSI